MVAAATLHRNVNRNQKKKLCLIIHIMVYSSKEGPVVPRRNKLMESQPLK